MCFVINRPQASIRNTTGLLSSGGLLLIHEATVLVLISSVSRVTSAAMHKRVDGLQTARISFSILSLRKGVSMKICVWPPTDRRSSSLSSFLPSGGVNRQVTAEGK